MPYKGFQYLLEAMQYLPHMKCILIGDGPLTGRLRQLAQRFGVAEQVLFTGRVSDAVLNTLLGVADVCCIPSVNRHESFGMIGLEALRAGCRLAVADIQGSGLPLLVRSGGGACFEPCSATAIAMCLQKLMREKATVYLAESYFIDRVAQQIKQQAYSKIGDWISSSSSCGNFRGGHVW